MARIRIAVLFGGASKDHAASLQSAYWVLKALPADKYLTIPVGITRKGRWLYFPANPEEILTGEWENDSDCCPAFISPDPIHGGIIKSIGNNEIAVQKIDVILSLLHGKYGMSGRIQGLFKLSGIPYIGSKPDSAAACTDKILTHLILKNAGIKTNSFFSLDRGVLSDLDNELKKNSHHIRYPMYVKPASCTPSIGAYRVNNADEMKAALKIAFSHHHTAIIEEAVIGRELECGVYQYGNERFTTVPGEIKTCSSFDNLMFTEKTSKVVIPAEIPAETAERIRDISQRAFQALGCRSIAKINFTLTPDGEIYCCKVYNVPGLAPMNMFPCLMETEAGVSYSEMLEMLITQAVENRV